MCVCAVYEWLVSVCVGTPQSQQSGEISALIQNNNKIDIDYTPFIRYITHT